MHHVKAGSTARAGIGRRRRCSGVWCMRWLETVARCLALPGSATIAACAPTVKPPSPPAGAGAGRQDRADRARRWSRAPGRDRRDVPAGRRRPAGRRAARDAHRAVERSRRRGRRGGRARQRPAVRRARHRRQARRRVRHARPRRGRGWRSRSRPAPTSARRRARTRCGAKPTAGADRRRAPRMPKCGPATSGCGLAVGEHHASRRAAATPRRSRRAARACRATQLAVDIDGDGRDRVVPARRRRSTASAAPAQEWTASPTAPRPARRVPALRPQARRRARARQAGRSEVRS